MRKVLVLALVFVLLCGTAQAADVGGWFKNFATSLGKGLIAKPIYHPIASVVKGNMKLPVIGTLQVFTGAGRALVELPEEVLVNAPSGRDSGDNIAKLGSANTFIEDHPPLKILRDGAVAAAAGGLIANAQEGVSVEEAWQAAAWSGGGEVAYGTAREVFLPDVDKAEK